MITYHHALDIIAKLDPVVGSIELPLNESHGSRLADDIEAPIDSPRFTNSAMDGFAVPSTLMTGSQAKILTTVAAESFSDLPKPQPNSCIRIMTGAPLPDGYDAVIPVEQTKIINDSTVEFPEPLEPMKHIRVQGEDIREGETILAAGEQLNAAKMLLLSSMGISKVPTTDQIRVGIITTGNELTPPGVPLKPGMIYNSNQSFLEAAIKELGLPIVYNRTIGDDPELAVSQIQKVFAKPGTLLITTGAVSAGIKDFIPNLAGDLGFRTIFHKVLVRPGKPVFLASNGESYWLGLPGNPISTLTGWYYFARPLLKSIALIPEPEKFSVIISTGTKKPKNFRCFYRGIVSEGQASLIGSQSSGHLRSLAEANALLELPEELEYVNQGKIVSAIRI